MAGPIRISILADGSQASRAFSTASRSAGSMGDSLKKAGKVAAVGVAAAAAGAVAVSKSLIDAGERAGTSNARINQVAESMGLFGDQAGKVSGRLVKLAEAQARATGVDQNAIKATQAKLLTFGELAETADKVGGNFDRATSAAVDLAAAGFGSAESNAVQLGKALNDPIKGLASLAKSGVTFTDTEKDRIATLVESNKMGEAQSLVLAAIEKQVGGTAQATANGTDKIRVVFSQLAERVGSVLVPIVDKVATLFVDKLLPAAARLGEELRGRLAPVFATIRDAVGGMLEKLQPVTAWLQANPELIKGAAIALGVAAAAATALGVAFAVIALATSPITLTVVAIAALGAGIAYAYKHSETFRGAVQAVGETISNLASAAVPALQRVVDAVIGGWSKIEPRVLEVWSSVQSVVTDALVIIREVVKKTTATVTGIWSKFGGTILSFITTTMKNVGTVVSGAFQVIAGLFKAVRSVLTGDWSGLWAAIKQVVSGALTVIKGVISQAWNIIKTVTSAAWTAIKALLSAAWEGIKTVISTQTRLVVSTMRALPGQIKAALGSLGSLLYNAGRDIIQGLLDGIGDMVGAVKSKLGEVTNLIPDWKGPPGRDRMLLREAGRLIMAGLIDGFTDGQREVQAALERVTRRIRDLVEKRETADGKAQAAIRKRIALLREERAELLKNARAEAREAVKTVRDAFGGFNLKGGQTRKEVRDEYAEFKRVLREAGIELPKNFDKLRERSLATADRFNAVTQRIEDTESALTRWRETATSVADSVRGLFNNNIFAKGGLAAAMLQLEADRNDTAERSNLLAGVKGIADALRIDTSSAAFQAIATSADVQTLRDLDTAAEVQAFFAAYQDRADAQNAAAEYAANAVTGQQIEAITTVLEDLTATQEVLRQQLERQETKVEQATLRGTRDGSRAGVRDAMRDESRTQAAKAKTR